jgi:hypothetical protein
MLAKRTRIKEGGMVVRRRNRVKEVGLAACHDVYELARRDVSAPGRSGSGVTRLRLTLVAWSRG